MKEMAHSDSGRAAGHVGRPVAYGVDDGRATAGGNRVGLAVVWENGMPSNKIAGRVIVRLKEPLTPTSNDVSDPIGANRRM